MVQADHQGLSKYYVCIIVSLIGDNTAKVNVTVSISARFMFRPQTRWTSHYIKLSLSGA